MILRLNPGFLFSVTMKGTVNQKIGSEMNEIITEKEISYMLFGLTSDLFYLNGNEFKGSKNHPFKDLHFGYLMHCLVFHSKLDFDDFMHIDDVWLELKSDRCCR